MPKKISSNVYELIGNTPLLRLNRVSEATGCNILGKCEFLNPGGSVKDRTALGIIRQGEADGLLKPGATIVEGTAGNTGIGLTLIANALGYKTRIVMPMNQSLEKVQQLEILGADLELVQVTGFQDPNHYTNHAKGIVEKMNKVEGASAFWSGQFDNRANKDIHYRTTGQEIWQQTDGDIDGFVCAAGTGGTIAGVAKALKEKSSSVQIALADPQGSNLCNLLSGSSEPLGNQSINEGIGNSVITNNMRDALIDSSFTIQDQEALPYVFQLLRTDGLCLGGSSGVNVAGAVKLAKELGPGHTVVTILCDYGTRYQSKIFNPGFLKARGLPCPDWLR